MLHHYVTWSKSREQNKTRNLILNLRNAPDLLPLWSTKHVSLYFQVPGMQRGQQAVLLQLNLPLYFFSQENIFQFSNMLVKEIIRVNTKSEKKLKS